MGQIPEPPNMQCSKRTNLHTCKLRNIGTFSGYGMGNWGNRGIVQNIGSEFGYNVLMGTKPHYLCPAWNLDPIYGAKSTCTTSKPLSMITVSRSQTSLLLTWSLGSVCTCTYKPILLYSLGG